MKTKWKVYIANIVILVVLGAGGYLIVTNYSLVFSKIIDGRVIALSQTNSNIDEFVIAIRTPKREIFTTRSEDPQWALVQAGQCAKAKYFPYPPWNMKEYGTFFGARMLNLRECDDTDGDWYPGNKNDAPQVRDNYRPEDETKSEPQREQKQQEPEGKDWNQEKAQDRPVEQKSDQQMERPSDKSIEVSGDKDRKASGNSVDNPSGKWL